MAQLPLDLGHRPALGRTDFLVAPPNAAAIAWLDRWPSWPSPALMLYGPAGSGKTHLAHVFAARSGAALIDPGALSIERVPALIAAAAAAAVDNADSVPEEALLHLHNVLGERGGHLLVVAREPPARWPIGLADLRSRLLAAPAVALAAPDDALLGAVLVKLFADRQLVVSEEVIAYLLVHLERTFAAARRIVAALDRAALAARRRVTVPLAREVLAGRLGED
ncbi:MAG TPA: DNA replication protein [Stellaceae bacterium]|nr:DNA replication protein [Stellaceae bacterium]